MTATKIALLAGAAVVVAGGLALVIKNSSTSSNEGHGTIAAPAPVATVQGGPLNPFTHVASIPASVDPSTIRFEKLKSVELASRTSTSMDPNCKDKQFREPDGSNCEQVKVEEKVKAIEALYSYNGTVMSAGESVPAGTTSRCISSRKKWRPTGRPTS